MTRQYVTSDTVRPATLPAYLVGMAEVVLRQESPEWRKAGDHARRGACREIVERVVGEQER